MKRRISRATYEVRYQRRLPHLLMTMLWKTLAQITAQFTRTVAMLTDKITENPQTRTINPPKCLFSGADHEDPEWFLAQFNAYFRQTNIMEDLERILIVENQLRGEAKRWQEPMKYVRETYAAFEKRLLRHFNSQTRLVNITASLYGEKQKKRNGNNVYFKETESIWAY